MITDRRRVLVVEDNPDNLYLATLLLEQAGYDVRPAMTGTEGITASQEGRYEFVLLDLQLPDVDGCEVAKQILEQPATSRLPIIAVSAFAPGVDRRRALTAGCIGYMEKPINPDAFIDQVRALASIRA